MSGAGERVQLQIDRAFIALPFDPTLRHVAFSVARVYLVGGFAFVIQIPGVVTAAVNQKRAVVERRQVELLKRREVHKPSVS